MLHPVSVRLLRSTPMPLLPPYTCNFAISGNNIKYLRVPDEVIDKVQEDPAKSELEMFPEFSAFLSLCAEN